MKKQIVYIKTVSNCEFVIDRQILNSLLMSELDLSSVRLFDLFKLEIFKGIDITGNVFVVPIDKISSLKVLIVNEK